MIYAYVFLFKSIVTKSINSSVFTQGHILTVAGVTVAICSAPLVGFLNLIALSVWPSWVAVAISETLRKVSIALSVFLLSFFCLRETQNIPFYLLSPTS